MTNEEKIKMLQAAVAQAETREEECRLNHLIALNQTQVLRQELAAVEKG